MKKLIFTPLMVFMAIIYVHSQEPDIDPELQWPSYRGYHARGVLENANLPDAWNLKLGHGNLVQ